MERVACRFDPGWRRFADPAWLSGWDPRPFDLGDGATEVAALGAGPPLVLLPPLPGWKEAWLPAARLLARRFRVVTFDLRERFAAGDRWAALLADLDRVADAFAPGPLLLAGHSLGGALALRWAAARPDRVRALALSSAFARVTTPARGLAVRFVEQPVVLAALRLAPERAAHRLAAALARRGRWVFDARCDAATIGVVTHGVRTVAPALAAARVRLALALDARGEAAALRRPALVVAGERDTAFARTAAADLVRRIPGARAGASPGAGHLHPMSNAAWFAEVVGGWLAEHWARG